MVILQNTSAYYISGQTVDKSWRSAQRTFTKHYQEECRRIAFRNLDKACDDVKYGACCNF